MVLDFYDQPRYADKPMVEHVKPPSPELIKLCKEMDANPNFHINREQNFYPKGFPSFSPGWGLG